MSTFSLGLQLALAALEIINKSEREILAKRLREKEDENARLQEDFDKVMAGGGDADALNRLFAAIRGRL